MPLFKRWPIFNILSLVTFLGNALVVVTSFSINFNENIFAFMFVMVFAIAISAIGILFALVSLLRLEKYLIFGLLALALNGAMLYWLSSMQGRISGP